MGQLNGGRSGHIVVMVLVVCLVVTSGRRMVGEEVRCGGGAAVGRQGRRHCGVVAR